MLSLALLPVLWALTNATPIKEMPPTIEVRDGVSPMWILNHVPLAQGRLDPIVSPGGVSGHVHAIVGGSAFEPTYHYADNLQAHVSIDKSNYWAPQLYRHNENGTFSLVKFKGSNTYYETRRYEQEPIYEFPPGFRMLAGNPWTTTFNESDPAQQAVRFACLGVPGPETNMFPPQSCPGDLRAEVYFPHCWDGVNAWLEGSAHVAYSSEGNFDGGGKCPDTHPKRIMGLFYEWFYEDDFEYRENARVLATGDYLGLGFHGDFTNGWPVGTFQKIFAEGSLCAENGGISDCKPLEDFDQHGKNGDCKYQGLLVDEDIGHNGPLTKLPGNNPLWGGTTTGTPIPNYTETAKFILNGAPVAPSPTPMYARVIADNILPATVKGDPPLPASDTTLAGGTDGGTTILASGGTVVMTSTSAPASTSTSMGGGMGGSSSSMGMGGGMGGSSSSMGMGGGMGGSSSSMGMGGGMGASSSSKGMGGGMGASSSAMGMGGGMSMSASSMGGMPMPSASTSLDSGAVLLQQSKSATTTAAAATKTACKRKRSSRI
ncbi:hypothetical protein TREMEDRAFT_65020 [Tremella mesenterica DSM 1558]|uniref:uncharacterized protein n=1 Tax=Tremella mesenterica (strain ATCC 24925 / CBS 8224 / DSM 1558 / NBRC 9311 / NRRL Y-6157 / RJB 2259-6 / UBC 559-6) TaxID=578456 RepID=UPI0003F4A2E3|nr:uncharacterized protein TREMEDRAFT_65020 [Tremella mesenterica DSM 1558]EIW67152.1 hypothetical protein TREMEDRAFT_65020 [Tremella mesenterica DSM 1558]